MTLEKGPTSWREYPPLYRYSDGRICTPALMLLELPNMELGAYTPRGVLVKRIDNFRIRKPGRGVLQFPWSDAHQGEDPADKGKDHPQPKHPGKPTRWDMDARGFYAPPGDPDHQKAQRVLVRFVLDDGLEFFDPAVLPAITAKDAVSQAQMANLTVDTTAGRNPRPRASFFVLRPAGPNRADSLVSFNIAVVAVDDTDPSFALPIIIDPGIPNRG